MALSPTIAVVTNVDYEHMDYYGHMDAIREAFINFINKIPFYGLAIICLDNEEIQGIIPHLRKRYITYGTNSQADLRATNIERDRLGVSFEVLYQNDSLGRVQVGIPGNHNVLNALAAIAVGQELDVKTGDIKEGLKTLGGLARRFQVRGEKGGILLVDDYGHHPTEITAVLETAKECWPDKRLVVVFQPHRYSRTKALYDRFAICFNQADLLIVAPIYPAGERLIEGVDAEWLCQGIKEHGHREVNLCHHQDEILKVLLGLIKPGDLVITLGAGDIYHVGEELLKKMAAGSEGRRT
jgi:UDP-N-acetylmuramate--alanine ligase